MTVGQGRDGSRESQTLTFHAVRGGARSPTVSVSFRRLTDYPRITLSAKYAPQYEAAGDDTLITIQPKLLKDVNVIIPSDTKNRILAIMVFFGFRLLLPLGLLVAGVVIWLRRCRR